MDEEKIKELFKSLYALKYEWEYNGIKDKSSVINEEGKEIFEAVLRNFLLQNSNNELGELRAKVNFYEKMIKKSNFAPFIEFKKIGYNDK